ncbi:hypothetical protein PY365_20385 [Roseiarcaceae bacterium H3SJ34-1]|nr:hypothetical protein [Roseiarcaceae bacterium H3SJ34-1]
MCVELDDLARPHDGDAVGDSHRLRLVVRNIDNGDGFAAHQLHHLDAHVLAQRRVEVAQRLVEQHQRPGGKATRDGDALLLSAGQFRGIAIPVGGKTGDIERMIQPLGYVMIRKPLCLEPEGQIVGDRHVRPQRIILEDHADPSPFSWYDRLLAPLDTSVQRDQSLFGLDQSGNDAQKRGLAGPAGAEKGHHFAGRDLEIEVV